MIKGRSEVFLEPVVKYLMWWQLSDREGKGPICPFYPSFELCIALLLLVVRAIALYA
jgi:hypothetical protein